MILMSLVGTGSRFGSRSEQRALALSAAQSLLDEYLAQPASDDSDAQITGVVEGRLPMVYRISISPFQLETSSTDPSNSEPTNLSGLNQITIEVFETEAQVAAGSARPLCVLQRTARARPSESPEDGF